MIKANELRIGSKLQLKNGQIVTVRSILSEKEKTILQFREDKLGYLTTSVEGGYLFPIPLTPEILERCGFQLATTGGYYRDFEGTSIIFFEKKGFFSLGYIGSKTIFLHQLQNLNFALTGEELEIKEPVNQ